MTRARSTRKDLDSWGPLIGAGQQKAEGGIVRQMKSGLDVHNGGDPDELPPKPEAIPGSDAGLGDDPKEPSRPIGW